MIMVTSKTEKSGDDSDRFLMSSNVDIQEANLPSSQSSTDLEESKEDGDHIRIPPQQK